MFNLETPLDTCEALTEYISAHIIFKDIEVTEAQSIKTPKRNRREENKIKFREYLFKHGIMNSRHYDSQLATCETLRSIELEMNVMDLEISKKTIFR